MIITNLCLSVSAIANFVFGIAFPFTIIAVLGGVAQIFFLRKERKV